MAAGITQPGAPGTSIFVEDNAHADADLDAILDVYSFNDFALKALASGDYTDLGTAEKVFRAKATIQNGDGAGTAATTIKDTDITVIWDATKTLAVSTVGSSNRTLELGVKVQGAAGKPSGRNGCKLRFGAATTLRGTIKVYGSYFRSTAALNLIPGSVGLGGELINDIMEASGFAIGQTSSGNFLRIYNLDLAKISGGGAAVTNWGADEAERVTIALGVGGASAFISTGSYIRIRDLVMVGTPVTGDVQLTSVTNESDFIEPTWSGNAQQVIATSTQYLNEWWRYLPLVQNADTAARLANVPVMLADKNGTDIFGIKYTDAQGLITYNTDPAALGIFNDVVKVRRGIGGAGLFAWEELGPFTVRVNLDGTPLPNYLGTQFDFNFPRRTGAFGDQFGPMTDAIPLIPASGTREDWRGGYA